MKLILLSGGSGKRLWPLSNDTRSKQFLKVLENNNGEKQSMVQRVWSQLKNVGLADSSIISTSKSQTEILYNQLGTDIPLIIEPERRDTFPAIALASTFLYSVQNVDLDETVLVLPVDPYVQDDFFEKMHDLEKTLQVSNADLALIGIKPTYPSSKYGYIIPKEINSNINYIEVDKFIEKPNEEEAAKLILENAQWNSGIFAFKLRYLIEVLKEKNLSTNFTELSNMYSDLPKISFDYEVVERTKNIVVMSYEGSWKDLGTWNTLTEEMVSPQIGKGIISENSRKTHLVNELEIPIAILGLSDVIVAASPDGILVSSKENSPQVKDLLKGSNQPPMYEERIWGWSKVLDYAKYNNEEMVTKRICIHSEKNSTYHYHMYRDEVWTIVSGEGELILDTNISRVKAGDIIHIPANRRHAIKAISNLEFIEIQTGREIVQSDVIRLYTDWKDILEHYSNSHSKVIDIN